MGIWLMDTAGIGSIIVLAVGLSVLAAYIYMLRWIQTTPPDTSASSNVESEGNAATEAGGEQA